MLWGTHGVMGKDSQWFGVSQSQVHGIHSGDKLTLIVSVHAFSPLQGVLQ